PTSVARSEGSNDSRSHDEPSKSKEPPKTPIKPTNQTPLRSKSPAPPRAKTPSAQTSTKRPPLPRKLTIIEQLAHNDWEIRVEALQNLAHLIAKRSQDNSPEKRSPLPSDEQLVSVLLNMF